MSEVVRCDSCGRIGDRFERRWISVERRRSDSLDGADEIDFDFCSAACTVRELLPEARAESHRRTEWRDNAIRKGLAHVAEALAVGRRSTKTRRENEGEN